ncbi:MAG: leucine-rich repeat protein [Hungatella hathewayi]|nr:leucine-rich repeat protein [Hungatella hathewayi]
MKRKYKQVISTLMAVLLISTQPAVMAWADSMAPADHLLGDDENTGKKTGYATPTDADQKDEDALKPDDAPKGDEIPSTEIPSNESLTDEKGPENESSGNTEKVVIRWEFVDDDNLSGGELSLIGVSPENRADFDTVVSMLPDKVRVEIEETGEVTLPIIDWSCPEYQQDEDEEWPFTGEYEFIAELPEGYVCEPPISVLVTLGGAMVNTINDRFTVDGLRYKELGPDTVQLIGYDGAKPTGTLVIPEHVRKPSNDRQYQVISIGGEAFLDCSGLTGDLVIPDTVTKIGDSAFEGCHFTGELTLSDSLVTIGKNVFYDCGFTGQLVLPQTLTRIGNSAFAETTFSGQLILPEKLNYIGIYAFMDCNFTGDLIIPEGITNTGYGAFSGNSFTGTLTLPKKLKEINRESFSSCGFTGELNIPDTVTDIGYLAFFECGFTGGLVLPDGLTSIGSLAFKDCSNLTGRLSIPDEITSIGNHAFDNTGFTSFDTTKQEIADLLYASGVDKNIIKVGNQSYQPTSSPQEFSAEDLDYQVIGNNTVKVTDYRGNSNTDIVIPDTAKDQVSGKTYTVTQIGSYAFWYKNITGSLYLPNTLVSIEEYAFAFNRFTGSLSLPESLNTIGDCAFLDNNFTGDLTIPENVSHIEGSAFESAGFTGNLIVECKLTYLESQAFYNCGFTGTLSLPDTLTAIESNTFRNCGFTGSLQLPAGLTSIGDFSFSGCNGFTGVLYLPKPVTEIGKKAFYDCGSLDSAHLGSNLQKLGIQAFPESLPLSTDSPRVQLLINAYLNQDAIADTSWDGNEDVSDGALATVKQDTTVTGDKRIGTEAVITVPSGVTLTVDGNLVVNGTISVEGTLVINGSLSGSGTLIIGVNGRVVGDTSGIRVVYVSRGSSGNSGSSVVNPDILIGTWERTEDGIWKFRQARGTYVANRWGIVDGLWYYFDKEGRMLTGWQYINNQWYYLCREEDSKTKTGLKEGAMATGWHFDPIYQAWFYLDTSGAMAVGQKMIDGKQYYFNPEPDGTRGAMQQ